MCLYIPFKITEFRTFTHLYMQCDSVTRIIIRLYGDSLNSDHVSYISRFIRKYICKPKYKQEDKLTADAPKLNTLHL